MVFKLRVFSLCLLGEPELSVFLPTPEHHPAVRDTEAIRKGNVYFVRIAAHGIYTALEASAGAWNLVYVNYLQFV